MGKNLLRQFKIEMVVVGIVENVADSFGTFINI